MARLWRLLLEDGWRLEPEGKKETLKTKVVSNGVEGVSAYPDGVAWLNGDVLSLWKRQSRRRRWSRVNECDS